MKWDPTKYVQFGDYRDRPFFDLTARIHAAAPARVVDLGCGPGNLTATLAERWPGAAIQGIDSSAEMLAKAAPLAADLPALQFTQADIAAWMPDSRIDVVVSNAALQWFAMQVPGNFNAPSHALMRSIAASDRWSEKLDGVLRGTESVGEPADYLDILLDAGCAADAWETSYQQVLAGPDPVLEWVRGTALRPVMAALGGGDAKQFETEYAAALRKAYPPGAHGTIFPFRRIFAVGRKLE
jgi:trans-aconitate 2-methyltransferase